MTDEEIAGKISRLIKNPMPTVSRWLVWARHFLHPKVVDFVAEASSQGRRTALVTNAMFLDAPMSREMLKAGLDSIAFRIDGPNQDIAHAPYLYYPFMPRVGFICREKELVFC